jgi:hypothetical protein
MEVGGQRHAPAALPPGKTGRPQGRPERVRKISPSPGFDPRTFQPVASRYTECAIPAPKKLSESRIIIIIIIIIITIIKRRADVTQWESLHHFQHFSHFIMIDWKMRK